MGDKTKIEWTDATWNPVTGCTKVSAGCKFCYAERDFHRPYPGRAFTDVRTHPERLDQPLRWKRPRRIFINSMSDLFHEVVGFEFIRKVFNVMDKARWHTFQILTKRPERMKAFFYDYMKAFAVLGNVWLGVSVEDQETADERIPLLLQTPAAVRFVSYEPALGPVDLALTIPCGYYCDEAVGHVDHGPNGNLGHIDWVIAGGESGTPTTSRPSDLEWFRSVRDQCQAASVPFFMKQITEKGRKLPMESWPADLRVREFPDLKENALDLRG